MKYTLFLLLFLSAQIAIAQPINQTDAQGRKTGPWKKVYGNGKVRYSGQFMNDKPIGLFQYFDTNGILTTEITHLKDGHLAICKMYFSNKKIRATGFYYDQLKDSVWIYYSESSGQKLIEEHYQRGKKHGIWRVYYESGTVFSEITYANDLENGPWNEYFETGTKRLSANYTDSLLSGRYSLYNLNGDTLSTGTYLNGVRQGIWTHYNQKGQKELVEYCRDGWAYKEEIYKNGVLFETKMQASRIKEN